MITAAASAFVCVAALISTASASASEQPRIDASWVTEVTASGANLRASINANSLSTGYHFEYISEAAYLDNRETDPLGDGFEGAERVPQAKEAGIGNGTSAISVAQHVGDLSPATAYRYRPVATNSVGTTIGPEHVLVTEETSLVFGLPDDRGWEMVSPVDKNGGAIASLGTLFGGGDFQAAAAGGAVAYGSATAFGDAVGAPPSSQYLARRTAVGWTTENVSTPLDSIAYGEEPDGAPYRLFSADLSKALLFGGLACRGALEGCPAPNPVLPGSGAPDGYMAYYLRGSAGIFSSLLSKGEVELSEVDGEHFDVSFASATSDLSHVILSSCAKLTADAEEALTGPRECDPALQNLYEWSGGVLALVNVLPGEASGTPGARIAAPVGAVSSSGGRIYFTQLENGALYLREAGGATRLLPETSGGGASFEAASADGSVALYTVGGELYRYEASTGAAAPIAAGVAGVLGISVNGSYVYFQGPGGLELWHGGTTTTVAPGADAAAPSDYPPATATARVSPQGARIAFLSTAELTAYDNHDAGSGEPDAELYLYDPATEVLICASCNPTGERPEGGAAVPGALVNGTTRAYQPRWVSRDGSRIFFDSGDSLVAQDTNSHPDVYEWEAPGNGDCSRSRGCVRLLSSGRSPGPASLIDASADGVDAFFVTSESLVGVDPGSIDLYDARVDGGFSEPSTPIPCVADACQSLPVEPEDPTPGTLTPNVGNPQRRFVKQKGRHRKRRHRHRRSHHRRHPSRGGAGRHHGGSRRDSRK